MVLALKSNGVFFYSNGNTYLTNFDLVKNGYFSHLFLFIPASHLNEGINFILFHLHLHSFFLGAKTRKLIN